MSSKRGQAAMEFLMTYGWAILVIIIVLSVLFYMGVLNPKSTQPDVCLLPSGFSCYSFKIVNGSGALILDLGQSVGKQIVVTAISCSMNASVQPIPLVNNITIASGEHAFIAGSDPSDLVNCTDENGNPIDYAQVGDSYRGRLCVKYVESDTGVERVVCGDISGRFEPGYIPGGSVPCAPNCPINAGCVSNSTCASGYCDPITSTCQPQPPLQPGWFFGKVTDPANVSGATVNASDGVSFWSNTTNATGDYVVYVPHSGDYSLNVTKAGYTDSFFTGAPIQPLGGGTKIDFLLTSTGLPSCSPNCPTDSPCTDDSNCTSGFCDPVTWTCENCTSNCANGMSCTSNSTCASDYCNQTTWTCQTAPPPSTVISSCPYLISTPGDYSLTADINTTSTALYCIGVSATGSGSTLDCNGHSISRTAAWVSNTQGVHLMVATNVVVRNCRLNGWDVGIRLYSNSDYNTVELNTVEGNQGGIIVDSAGNNNIIRDNIVRRSTGIERVGINLNNAKQNTVTGNTVSNMLWGIYFINYAQSNTLSGNTICSSSTMDIICDATSTGNSGSSTFNTTVGCGSGIMKSASCP